jgi:hypothetical protein
MVFSIIPFLLQVTIPIVIAPNQWVVMIEQFLLFILIIGRWLLPKGEVTRDELSQLLMVYLGMAADIIECKSCKHKVKSYH